MEKIAQTADMLLAVQEGGKDRVVVIIVINMVQCSSKMAKEFFSEPKIMLKIVQLAQISKLAPSFGWRAIASRGLL